MDSKNIIIMVLIIAIVAVCALFAGMYIAGGQDDDSDDVVAVNNTTEENKTVDSVETTQSQDTSSSSDSGNYVTADDGTGIVHIAPAYGEDDSLVAKANGITFINLVDREGRFVEEVTPWAGKFVKKCDESICKWLEENNKLFKWKQMKFLD